jgi:hypothetical protein
MRKFTFIVAAIIVISTLASGCSRNDDRPTDLPSLFPCTITVTQDGVPLAGATVSLVSSTEAKYRSSSITDEKGNASMITYGFPGVPEGKYKVTVRKEIMDDMVYGENQSTGEKNALIRYKTYRTVDPTYSSANHSPYEIEITNSKRRTQQTFDVGKAVKIEFKALD